MHVLKWQGYASNGVAWAKCEYCPHRVYWDARKFDWAPWPEAADNATQGEVNEP